MNILQKMLRWAVVLLCLWKSSSLHLGLSSRMRIASRAARGGVECSQSVVSRERVNSLQIIAGDIPEFDDDAMLEEDNADPEEDDGRTDMEKELTHGYEGDFKKGECIRVLTECTIYSVKPFLNEGLNPKGMEGEIADLVLYGRKHKSLCSAITPIKVKFKPGGPGVPSEIERPFFLHFEASEVERR